MPVFGGGITSPGSVLRTRTINSLLSGWPGTSVVAAPSRVSRRRSAFRSFSSGAWHVKQLFDRMGRTSRLKSTGWADATPVVMARTATRVRRVGMVGRSVGRGRWR